MDGHILPICIKKRIPQTGGSHVNMSNIFRIWLNHQSYILKIVTWNLTLRNTSHLMLPAKDMGAAQQISESRLSSNDSYSKFT